MFFGEAITYESLIGRWRQTVQMFGDIFCDDVGLEPGSIITELGGFPIKETKFRRDMEKSRNTQQRDLSIEVCNCMIFNYVFLIAIGALMIAVSNCHRLMAVSNFSLLVISGGQRS